MASVRSVPEARATHVHNTNLDLDSVQELPDSHTWPALDDCPTSDSSDAESVPIIDLTDPDVVSQLHHACETWGMFRLKGHGVPMALVDGLKSQAHRFFSMPIEQKLKAARGLGDLSGYGQAYVASFFEKAMWSEGFTMADSPVNMVRRLWPDDYAEFCDVMEEYKKEVKALAVRTMWLILSSLGISKEDVDWAGPKGDFDESMTALHLNWYPRCPDPKRAIGMAAHTDSVFLTILYPSSTSGLQVLRENGAQSQWLNVEPVPGSFVVNVGDLLHILTDGRLRSPFHRVLVNKTKPRLSAAFFLGPPKDISVGPFSKLIDAWKGPTYRAVKVDEYLGLKKKHYQDALAFVRQDAEVKMA